jgi:hypothetical protein
MRAGSKQDELVALEPKQLGGAEHFRHQGVALPRTVSSFWSWAYSNLAANNLRGHLAEFIVASDFGLTHGTRVEWDDCDLHTETGLKVEVKSAAYLQSWNQRKHSAISFGIAPTVAWDAKAKARSGKSVRSSDAYIFCLLAHKDKPSLNPLDLDQWKFFVLPTSILNSKLKSQKTLTLSSLLQLNPVECQYGEIAQTLARVLGNQ